MSSYWLRTALRTKWSEWADYSRSWHCGIVLQSQHSGGWCRRIIKFKVSLGYIVSCCPKIKENNKIHSFNLVTLRSHYSEHVELWHLYLKLESPVSMQVKWPGSPLLSLIAYAIQSLESKYRSVIKIAKVYYVLKFSLWAQVDTSNVRWYIRYLSQYNYF